MVAVLQLPPPDLGDLSLGVIQETLAGHLTLTDPDLTDPHLPALPSPSKHLPADPQVHPPQRDMPQTDASRAQSWIDYPPVMNQHPPHLGAPGVADGLFEEPLEEQRQLRSPRNHDTHDQQEAHMPDGTSAAGVYPLPSGSPPRLHHNNGVDDRPQRIASTVGSGRKSSTGFRASLDVAGILQNPEMGQRVSGVDEYRESPVSLLPSSPQHPSLSPVSPSSPAIAGPSGSQTLSIVPMSAGPSYNAIPISSRPRAYAQQPTYITPTSAPSPINPIYNAQQIPKEEVCVECAMRDQDMADVDVTSPGVWERESDALYEELLCREKEEVVAGIPPPENSSRPRAKGQKLTEENLKLWISINPKEPSSRQQTLDQYVKSQRSLLEAEALAHARAIRESRQLDDRMRDTYSQLRRSAYELGSSAQPSDDTGGVRIKAPRSPSIPVPYNSYSREVTLMENGMIVEHVDVRKEEKEERDRRKKEEKRERSRARKSSRGSRAADVMSVYSLQTPLHTDSGFFSGVKSDSRYSQSISPSARPSSVMTGGERPHTLLRAQSQASFSDMQSIGSAASPRRSRFFGLKNLSSGWRSQDSLAPSGSMIDMHVALQREQQYFQSMPHPEAVDIGSNAPTVRLGEPWPMQGEQAQPEAQPSKKAKGLKKIWKLVTGSTNQKVDTHMNGRVQSRSLERTDDDLPLAPPPPLSYLVNRDQGASSRRHVSTPSLPSSVSPYTLSPYAASPPTAPSSLIPSPTSSRRSTADKEGASDGRKNSEVLATADPDDQGPVQEFPDSDSRGRTPQSSRTLSSGAGPLTPSLPSMSPSQMVPSPVLRRDKSLPPLPGEAIEFPNVNTHPLPESRPQTVFTYDPRSLVDGLSPPKAPFRTAEARRQSFGGIGVKSPFKSQTLPGRGMYGRVLPSYLAEEKYGEFGIQQHNGLGQWPGAQFSQGSLQVPVEKVKKRKSKFGLAALFGKKTQEASGYVDPAGSSTYSRPSHVEVPFESTNMSGYASPMSTSTHTAPRVSVSKKNLDELVDQEPEFIAYRYPSSDQRLDLMR